MHFHTTHIRFQSVCNLWLCKKEPSLWKSAQVCVDIYLQLKRSIISPQLVQHSPMRLFSMLDNISGFTLCDCCLLLIISPWAIMAFLCSKLLLFHHTIRHLVRVFSQTFSVLLSKIKLLLPMLDITPLVIEQDAKKKNTTPNSKFPINTGYERVPCCVDIPLVKSTYLVARLQWQSPSWVLSFSPKMLTM